MPSSTVKTATPRIDTLKAGTFVRLGFGHREDELAIFLGVTGIGDQRRARFAQPYGREGVDGFETTYTWEAYRFNGGWVYGWSSDRLRLLEVIS